MAMNTFMRAFALLMSSGLGNISMAAGSDEEEPTHRVLITGSNISRFDGDSPSPVQVLTRQDIERSGKTSVSELLRALPLDNSGTLSQAFSIAFAGGASGISLRGLSLNATLVLVNGQRMAPYPLSDDGQRSFVDLSSIPLIAVDRIEILKDGASAIYGSDAIAGVVNIILKQEVTRTQFNVAGGGSYKGDGLSQYAALSRGFGNMADEGHGGYVALELRKQQAIQQRARNSYLSDLDLRNRGGPDLRGGIIPPGNVAPSNFTNTVVGMVAPLDSAGRQVGPFRLLPGCAAENLNYSGGCTWDTLRHTLIQPATQNINLFTRFNVSLPQAWYASFDLGWFNSRAEQFSTVTYLPQQTQTDPATSNLILPGNHPDNPFGPSNPAFLYYAFGDVGPRHQKFETNNLRLVGSLDGHWSDWEIGAGAGVVRSSTHIQYEGHVRTSVLASLLASGIYRLGARAGLNTADTYAQLAPKTHSRATSTLSFANFKATRSLMPLEGGPLALLLGADVRRQDIDNPGQPYALEGDLQGTFSAFARGRQNAYAAFGELAAPLARNFEISLAARHERHPGIGHSTVPKAGLKWSPVATWTLRGTYSRGFRVPGIAEVGNSALNAFTNYSNPDRCPVTRTPADCSGPVVVALSGNQRLQPEKSESSILGLSWSPSSDSRISLDYYRIRRSNEIVPTPFDAAQPIFGGPDLGNPALPPPIVGFRQPYINANATQTSGLDLDVRHRIKLGTKGDLTAALQFTRIFNFDQTIGGQTYRLAGTHGPTSLSGNVGTPANRATATLAWTRGPIELGTHIHHVSGMSGRDPLIGNACLMLEFSPDCRIASFTSFDAFGRYQLDQNTEISFTVQNVFNRLPPLDTITYGGINYNPALHQSGAIGRYFQVGARIRF